MKYTIEQINEAWVFFNKPFYFVDSRKVSDEEIAKGIIEYSGKGQLQIIPKTDFISFLVGFFTKKGVSKKTNKVKKTLQKS